LEWKTRREQRIRRAGRGSFLLRPVKARFCNAFHKASASKCLYNTARTPRHFLYPPFRLEQRRPVSLLSTSPFVINRIERDCQKMCCRIGGFSKDSKAGASQGFIQSGPEKLPMPPYRLCRQKAVAVSSTAATSSRRRLVRYTSAAACLPQCTPRRNEPHVKHVESTSSNACAQTRRRQSAPVARDLIWTVLLDISGRLAGRCDGQPPGPATEETQNARA
jgi:hypothetical protein